MSQITTHVLDISSGKPASGISARLLMHKKDLWVEIATGNTNSDGRITDLLNENETLEPGEYKMYFDTGSYFEEKNLKKFYPYVEIIFEITDKTHYHIPLLLSPFGYTTYRGS